MPDRTWELFEIVHRDPPGTPPPPEKEASYEWYVTQYPDTGRYTAIGPPGDPAEVGVSIHGELVAGKATYDLHYEPFAGTPYIPDSLCFGFCREGRVVPVGSEGPVRQSLEEGCLPIVLTESTHDAFVVRQTAFARPLRRETYIAGNESTLAWAVYDLQNTSKQTQQVVLLAIEAGDEARPRKSLTFQNGVVFQDGSALLTADVPAGFQVEFEPVLSPEGKAMEQDSELDLLRNGGAYNALVVRGRCAPGQKVRIAFCRVFSFPGMKYREANTPTVTSDELRRRSFEEDWNKARETWKTLAAKVARFDTPDAALNRIVIKGMLDGYFLTKRWDGMWTVFDSVCYRCQWDDASTKWFFALDLMGDHDASRRLLDTVFARQGQRKPKGTSSREGCFSDVTNTEQDFSDASWTSCNGWALWSMAQHARLTGDRAWLLAHKQQILAGCQWISRERRQTKPDSSCAGLIAGKFVCDMADDGELRGVGHFTYNDAISYMGLHMIAQLFDEWGLPEGRTLREEAEAYRNDIVTAVDRLTDKSQDPWFIPWALDAPRRDHAYFNGVCGPINLAFGGVLPRNDEKIDHVIRWNIEKTHKGSYEESAAANMFYSQDLAVILLEQGRVEKFLRMFYTVLAANISHQTLTTDEWRAATQPHIHSIASMVRMARTMLIQERDDGLYLLQGTPRRWLEGGQKIIINEAPTWYGPLSLTCESDPGNHHVRVAFNVPDRLGERPIHLRLRLPQQRKITSVTVNGQPHFVVQGEWIRIEGRRGSIEILAGTSGVGDPR